MEGKFLVSLLILGLASSSLAKGGHRGRDHDHDRYHKKHDDDKKCPPLYTSPDLPMKCSTSGEGCSKITCSTQLDGQTVTLSLQFNSAEDVMSATITLKVPNLDYEWSHTFKSGDKIQVPGFPLKIKGVANADMYLMLKLVKGKMGVAFKVDLYVKIDSSEPLDVTLVKGKVPHMEHHRWSKCGRFASWFKRQSTAVKASIIVSAILVSLMVVFAIAYCCKKRRTSASKLGVKPPTYEEATYPIKSKVPMEPLVNEE
ncbi:uncharacterized protein [Porites lutea]|uniref:uncharacterized protein n=1 Tax=Porites lutea TaxID=51062 RepID=UPI003CC664AF